MYYRPLLTALALSALLATTPAAAVSLSGACESIANVGARAARQRDAGVSLRESLADVADYGKLQPGEPTTTRSRAITKTVSDRYTAAVRVAYSSSKLTPAEIFDYVDAKCMGSEYVKREEFSMAPSVPQAMPVVAPQVMPATIPQGTPVAVDIARMQAEIDTQMRKMQDDNAAQWASKQAEALRQEQAKVSVVTPVAADIARRQAEIDAQMTALQDKNAAAWGTKQPGPTFWEILSTPSHPTYSTSCYTSSYGGKRYRSTYTRCY